MHASEALHPWWGYNAKQDIKTETISGIHHILQSMLSSSGEKVQLPRTPVSLLLLLVTSVVSDSLPPHRQQPTRLPCPWDPPDKNTGVGCHFLLQRVKVKSESEVAQSCPTLCDPLDCSPPGSAVPRILQARTLEWVAISFSNPWKWKVKVKWLSRVQLFVTPWTAAYLGLLCPWDFPSKSTGVGCHCLLHL